MKTRFKLLLLALTGSLYLILPNLRAEVDVSVGVQVNAVADFQAPLTPHGAWVEVGGYGRCWRPAGVAVGWRPYCDGHWEWTDCGWYWVSDEPWAWACYHYGSWYMDPFHGWVWVPGIEWAPSWVYWRVGGGHIGWAPCGPRGVVLPSSSFVFVGAGRFHERVRPSTVIVNNTTIINNTTQITEIRRETRNIGGRQERVVVNEGPGVEVVQKATNQKFAAAPVQEVDRRTSVPAEVKRRRIEARPQESPSGRGDQIQPAPERKTTPANPPPPDKAVVPDRVSPPDKNSPPERVNPPRRDDVKPLPKQRPAPSKGKQDKKPPREQQKNQEQDKS